MPRLLGEDWLVPEINAMTRTYFTSGALRFQTCNDCGAMQHPPEEICGRCQSTRFSWRSCGPEGTVVSRVVVHQAVHPMLQEAVPYAVVVVDVDDAPGVNVVGNVLGVGPDQVEIGQRVRVCFEEWDDPEDDARLLIPQWEPA